MNPQIPELVLFCCILPTLTVWNLYLLGLVISYKWSVWQVAKENKKFNKKWELSNE